jgi:hypothetical protein
MRVSVVGSILVVGWVLAFAMPPAAPAAPPAPSGAPAPSGPQYSTQVKGAVPDLAGRWLAVTHVLPPQGGSTVYTVVQPWEVTVADGKPQLTVRFVKLTPPLEEALAAANKDGRAWEPGEADLRALRDAWSSLPSSGQDAARVDTVITARHAFTPEIAADEQMKGAAFLIQITVDYNPGPQRPMKDVFLYGVIAAEPFGYRGNYASASVVPAPVPIPIALKGTFRLYSLDALAGSGFLRRILDLFSGCGRAAR